MTEPNSSHANDDVVEVDGQKLRSHLVSLHSSSRHSSEAGAEYRDDKKNVAETLGVHKKALGIVEELDRMSVKKRADVLRSLRPMWDTMLPDWLEQSQDMIDKAEQEAKDMEDEMDG